LSSLEPVYLEIRQDCAFRAKPCKACGLPRSNRVHTPKKTATCAFRGQRGCASCGRFKKDRAHFGAPPSINPLGSGDPGTWQGLKDQWSDVLREELEASDLPRGLFGVFVEGEAVFPQRAGRDQGNFRIILEKALGDVLAEGGWIEDDTWDRYEFGNLAQRIEPGVSATRLMLLPRDEPGPTSAPAPEELALPV
jgi:hypothetical protein